MTKIELAKKIAEINGITDMRALKIVHSVFDCIIESLVKGCTSEFRDFGVFKVKLRKKRIGRNPKTGVLVKILPRRVVIFKPGLKMRIKVRSHQLYL